MQREMNTMREIIETYIDVSQSKMLEIGAFDRPTFTKEETEIYFLDALTTEELIEEAEKSPVYKKEKIVPIDYRVESNDLTIYVHDTFDAIIADNVFEHISNPINYLITLHKLLNEGGYIFLCIPEYEQIFDRFRTPTTLSHLLADYFENVPDLDPRHSVELALFYDMNYVGKENRLDERLDMKRLRHAWENPHFGLHCHAFSSKTFASKIINPILKLGLMDLSLVSVIPININFVVVLQKKDAPLVTVPTWEEFVADDKKGNKGYHTAELAHGNTRRHGFLNSKCRKIGQLLRNIIRIVYSK